MAFPEGFIKRIEAQASIDAGNLLRALEEPSPSSIRLNRSKWKGSPLSSEPVPWCDDGFYLERRPSYTADPLFHSGCYYPQEASSMFLEQAVKQSAESTDGIRILDLCGAPGGKSTHLAAIAGKNSFIVSNEVIRQRAAVLTETLTKWGTGNVIVTQSDPGAFGRLQGYFDIIVIDAPCSGEGMFRNPVAVSEWSDANAALCAERQKRILMDAWPALRQDGLMVYSTCTFNPGENEENIKWLLQKDKADCLRLDISAYPGIREIDYEGIYGYGFYPGKIKGEGFFISVVRKKEESNETRVRNRKNSQLQPGRNELAAAGELSLFPEERIIKIEDEIVALPCDPEHYILIYDNLKVIKPGTRLLTMKKNGFLPVHDLALSTSIRSQAFPRKELTYDEALAYLRRDNFAVNDLVRGWNILTYSGINLGFVNNIGSRFNNYYPVGWRIRMDVKDPDLKGSIIQWHG